VQVEKDGSFGATVRLTYMPIDGPGLWRVVAVVVRESEHFAVDDVIYLKDKDLGTEYRLSEVLAEGCDGTHWVGRP